MASTMTLRSLSNARGQRARSVFRLRGRSTVDAWVLAAPVLLDCVERTRVGKARVGTVDIGDALVVRRAAMITGSATPTHVARRTEAARAVGVDAAVAGEIAVVWCVARLRKRLTTHAYVPGACVVGEARVVGADVLLARHASELDADATPVHAGVAVVVARAEVGVRKRIAVGS